MVINYYVIKDPEIIAHGITLSSAEAGFFYKVLTEATATKEKLSLLCEGTKSISEQKDPFAECYTEESRSDLSTRTELSTLRRMQNVIRNKLYRAIQNIE